MVQTLADELKRIVDETAPELRAFAEEAASAKRKPEVWSIKETLGHLIDSAANNHQRFVRAQQVDTFSWPGYAQEAWVRLQDHQSRPWLELVEFWIHYNRHLAHTIARIPDKALNVPCRIGTSAPVTLGFLLQDYLSHLRHHLKQIRERTTE
jgi:hypothetical protein